ncbi:helix-turn-helix domain-containing protein, partial [Mesorhizobium sp. M4B.F.Ca.ET.190.01.1.1]|uniref:helix-turn-helix domain-containing protein n=1 Tax=Mesorhizobium sp. M4B.F.Ca.ET.190.01.1.1 TaxID=2563951 RepID=UPI001FE0A16C
FTRRFQKSIGTSFGDWLADQRAALAQRLLEQTDKSIDMVAFEAGFGSATSLRQHFSARLRTSPMQYRREFSKTAGVLTAACPPAPGCPRRSCWPQHR